MLFNSAIFLFAFLPLCWGGYFLTARIIGRSWAQGFIVAASLFFYSWWNPLYLPLLLISISGNYGFGLLLSDKTRQHRKLILGIGITLNLSALAYFKYANFLLGIAHDLSGADFAIRHIILPLGISFITFQKIAYLVDSYRDGKHEYSMLEFAFFVTFFPQLISGPITHHKEVIPQFARADSHIINWQNMAAGLTLLAIGLFKKAVIADHLSPWVAEGFASSAPNLIEAWAISLSYTMQLYFDFSGYCDMAIGLALMFNIQLPYNFLSPYKATNIQDFWRRWHITLSRFLRDYLYFPLGGSKNSLFMTCRNLFITFLLGGLWHGASWMFVAWGAMHGFATVIHRLWQQTGIIIPRLVSWAITFLFVHSAWVFFRAPSMKSAVAILKGMAGFNGIVLPKQMVHFGLHNTGAVFPSIRGDSFEIIAVLIICSAIAFFAPNSRDIANRLKTDARSIIAVAILLYLGIAAMLASPASEFLYFNF